MTTRDSKVLSWPPVTSDILPSLIFRRLLFLYSAKKCSCGGIWVKSGHNKKHSNNRINYQEEMTLEKPSKHKIILLMGPRSPADPRHTWDDFPSAIICQLFSRDFAKKKRKQRPRWLCSHIPAALDASLFPFPSSKFQWGGAPRNLLFYSTKL